MRSAPAAGNVRALNASGENAADRRRALGAAVIVHGALLLGLLLLRPAPAPHFSLPADASRAPLEVVALAPEVPLNTVQAQPLRPPVQPKPLPTRAQPPKPTPPKVQTP